MNMNLNEKEIEKASRKIDLGGFEMRDELNPKIWDENQKMKPEVKKLTGVMIVYRIDTSKVNKLKLHDDPNFQVVGARGYYTYNNIPPSAMTKVKAFDTGKF